MESGKIYFSLNVWMWRAKFQRSSLIYKDGTKVIFIMGFSEITPTQTLGKTFQNLHTYDQMLVSHITEASE